MDGKDFKKELNNPKNIYCLVSTDSRLIDIYVDRFKNAIKADNISYGKIMNYGKLFKKKTLNVLYMPKLDEDIFNRPEYIFIYTDKIDKRSSIYKKHKDRIIELQNDFTTFIMQHSDFNEEQAKKFANYCNNDLGIIEHTLTIYNLSGSNYKNFTNYSSNSLQWVENFISKKPLVQTLDSPISILALLSTNCQNILNIKRKQTTNMNPYIIKCLSPLCDCRDEKSLANIISDCFYLDCQIKKGLIDIDNVLDYLIIRDY